VSFDAADALRAQHEADGIHIDARTGMSGWLGERLDVGWAIDVLHPLATNEMSPMAQLPELEATTSSTSGTPTTSGAATARRDEESGLSRSTLRVS
jgi:hypothetical protein